MNSTPKAGEYMKTDTNGYETREMVFNGKTITMHFPDKPNMAVMERIKEILSTSYTESQVCKN